jgi:hypothetical protein
MDKMKAVWGKISETYTRCMIFKVFVEKNEALVEKKENNLVLFVQN